MKRVIASVSFADAVQSAVNSCKQYPVAHRLLSAWLSYQGGSSSSFLDGVLACGEVLNRGDLSGLIELRDLTFEYGYSRVLLEAHRAYVFDEYKE